jgi:hypothetical protein
MDARVYESCWKCYPSTHSAICAPSLAIPYSPMYSPHLLYAWEHEVSVRDVASVLDLSEEAVKRAYKDFASKHRATAHLRETPHTLG